MAAALNLLDAQRRLLSGEDGVSATSVQDDASAVDTLMKDAGRAARAASTVSSSPPATPVAGVTAPAVSPLAPAAGEDVVSRLAALEQEVARLRSLIGEETDSEGED